jgi:hypothetical protein
MHPSKKPLPLSLPRHLLDLAAWLAGGALRLVRAAAAGVVNVWYQALLAPALARQGHGPAPPMTWTTGSWPSRRIARVAPRTWPPPRPAPSSGAGSPRPSTGAPALFV